MAVREERHARRSRMPRRLLSWIPETLIVLLVVAAFGNVEYDLGRRWFGLEQASPQTSPAEVLPPLGLELTAGAPAPAVASAASAGRLDPSAVRAALAPYVKDPRLGRHVAVQVSELVSGKVVYRRGTHAVTPASTMKLLTSAAALESIGPMTRFATRVVGSGRRIVLVGGGDPFLMSSIAKAHGLYPARADVATLAKRTAVALTKLGVARVRLGYDATLFTGPAVNPHWPASYIAENVVPPISALWVDEARAGNGRYVSDPAAVAASAFAAALRSNGIKVVGAPRPHRAAPGTPELAIIHSAPLGEIVQHTLAVSDNNAAEVLARQVGYTVNRNPSFAGGSAAVFDVLGRLGLDLAGSRGYDGSGLSRDNRLTAQALLDVLELASSAEHPKLREVITGLPVAGFTGSLQWRFDKGPAAARGRVRAKTGTLTGVHGLAGIISDRNGNQMAFVMIADRVAGPNQLAAQHDLDLMAGALGACRCGP